MRIRFQRLHHFQIFSDVLKCKYRIFSILGKLIRHSDARSSQLCIQSIWKAIAVDVATSVMVSAWWNFSKVGENTKYHITNMKVENFNGVSLRTTIYQFLDSNFFKIIIITYVEKVICCPEILKGSVNLYNICNNLLILLCSRRNITCSLSGMLKRVISKKIYRNN